MRYIVLSEEINDDFVKQYRGLLGCPMYGDWDEGFRDFVTKECNWNPMHEFFGQELLIIIPEKARSSVRLYAPKPIDTRIYFIRPLQWSEEKERDTAVLQLSDWFGVDYEHRKIFRSIQKKIIILMSILGRNFLIYIKNLGCTGVSLICVGFSAGRTQSFSRSGRVKNAAHCC